MAPPRNKKLSGKVGRRKSRFNEDWKKKMEKAKKEKPAERNFKPDYPLEDFMNPLTPLSAAAVAMKYEHKALYFSNVIAAITRKDMLSLLPNFIPTTEIIFALLHLLARQTFDGLKIGMLRGLECLHFFSNVPGTVGKVDRRLRWVNKGHSATRFAEFAGAVWDVFLIPVKTDVKHWCLLAIYKIGDRHRLDFYDAGHYYTGRNAAREIATHLKLDRIAINYPQGFEMQKNKLDCGMYLMIFAVIFWRFKSHDRRLEVIAKVKEADMRDYRPFIAKALHSNSTEPLHELIRMLDEM